MFFKFKEYDFEEAFYFIFYCALIVSFIVAIIWSQSEKKVIAYELGSYEKGLTMNVNVDNSADYTIQLIGVSYEEAVELVNKANAGLVK